MNSIVATINCADKNIDIPLCLLAKYPFFAKQLLAPSMSHKINNIDKSTGVNLITNVYYIPCITLECRSSTLIKLLESDNIDLEIDCLNNDMIDLIFYNKLYQLGKKFVHCNKYSIDTYAKFLAFISDHFHNTDVYQLLSESGMGILP